MELLHVHDYVGLVEICYHVEIELLTNELHHVLCRFHVLIHLIQIQLKQNFKNLELSEIQELIELTFDLDTYRLPELLQ